MTQEELFQAIKSAKPRSNEGILEAVWKLLLKNQDHSMSGHSTEVGEIIHITIYPEHNRHNE